MALPTITPELASQMVDKAPFPHLKVDSQYNSFRQTKGMFLFFFVPALPLSNFSVRYN